MSFLLIHSDTERPKKHSETRQLPIDESTFSDLVGMYDRALDYDVKNDSQSATLYESDVSQYSACSVVLFAYYATESLIMIPLKRAVAWLDLILAALLAAVGLLVVITANRTPPNVDAGAIAEAGAVLFVLPAALMLGLAGLALWKNWRIGWLIQLVAVVGIPVLISHRIEPRIGGRYAATPPLSGRGERRLAVNSDRIRQPEFNASKRIGTSVYLGRVLPSNLPGSL